MTLALIRQDGEILGDLVTLIIGLAFCVVAWRPPENDPSKRRLSNPEGKRWRAAPYRPERKLEQIVRLLMLVLGVGLLLLGASRLIG